MKHARDADCGHRLPDPQERPRASARSCSGCTATTANSKWSAALRRSPPRRGSELLADLEPLRKGDDEVLDGEPSRWNSAADKRWIPLRPEKVAEVAYDQMEGNGGWVRFRHTVRLVRWRPDRDPAQLYVRPAGRPGELRPLRRPGVTLMPNPASEIDVDGVMVRITNPDKPFYPALGADGTKGRLIDYYRAVAGGPMLTALRDRPTHLQRFPDGIEGEEIYQKRIPQKHPDYLQTCTVTFPSGRTADALKITHPAAIVWAAQMGTVTLHPWPVRCPDTEHPDEAADRPGSPTGHRFPEPDGWPSRC